MHIAGGMLNSPSSFVRIMNHADVQYCTVGYSTNLYDAVEMVIILMAAKSPLRYSYSNK